MCIYFFYLKKFRISHFLDTIRKEEIKSVTEWLFTTRRSCSSSVLPTFTVMIVTAFVIEIVFLTVLAAVTVVLIANDTMFLAMMVIVTMNIVATVVGTVTDVVNYYTERCSHGDQSIQNAIVVQNKLFLPMDIEIVFYLLSFLH